MINYLPYKGQIISSTKGKLCLVQRTNHIIRLQNISHKLQPGRLQYKGHPVQRTNYLSYKGQIIPTTKDKLSPIQRGNYILRLQNISHKLQPGRLLYKSYPVQSQIISNHIQYKVQIISCIKDKLSPVQRTNYLQYKGEIIFQGYRICAMNYRLAGSMSFCLKLAHGQRSFKNISLQLIYTNIFHTAWICVCVREWGCLDEAMLLLLTSVLCTCKFNFH